MSYLIPGRRANHPTTRGAGSESESSNHPWTAHGDAGTEPAGERTASPHPKCKGRVHPPARLAAAPRTRVPGSHGQMPPNGAEVPSSIEADRSCPPCSVARAFVPTTGGRASPPPQVYRPVPPKPDSCRVAGGAGGKLPMTKPGWQGSSPPGNPRGALRPAPRRGRKCFPASFKGASASALDPPRGRAKVLPRFRAGERVIQPPGVPSRRANHPTTRLVRGRA